MDRRQFLALAAAVPLAGCTNPFDSPDPGRLSLIVSNQGGEDVKGQVTVTDDAGNTYLDEAETFSANTGRSWDVVDTEGRHTVTVSGDDWAGELAWQADRCAVYEATVTLSPGGRRGRGRMRPGAVRGVGVRDRQRLAVTHAPQPDHGAGGSPSQASRSL